MGEDSSCQAASYAGEVPLMTEQDVYEPRPGLFIVRRGWSRCAGETTGSDDPPCDGAFKCRLHDDAAIWPEWCVEIQDIVAFLKQNGRCILYESSGYCTIIIE